MMLSPCLQDAQRVIEEIGDPIYTDITIGLWITHEPRNGVIVTY